MVVTCINNEGTKTLVKGEKYIVHVKYARRYNMTLKGIPGMFGVERFRDENNNPIKYKDEIINHRNTLPHNYTNYYVRLKEKSTIVTLKKNHFYKIRGATHHYASCNDRILLVDDDAFGNKNMQEYCETNFHYYTEEEVNLIKRQEKIDQLKNRINESKMYQ